MICCKVPLRNEKELLKHEAEIARLALRKSSGLFLKSLWKILDIKEWAAEHPLQSTGTAAVLGFAVSGKLLSPPDSLSSSHQAEERKEASSFFSVLFAIGAELFKEIMIPLLKKQQGAAGKPQKEI